MLFSKAINRFNKSEYSKNLKDYFLVSLFSSFEKEVSEWTLLFFNPKTNKTVDINIDDKITKDEKIDAIKNYKKLEIEKVNVGHEEVLDIINPKNPIKILITLHMKKHPMWTVNLIHSLLKVKTFVVDAIDGKIIEEKETSLLR